MFIGLDSFEGLPEKGGDTDKGTFNVNGEIPEIEDPRISYIKGWFQSTWFELENNIKSQTSKIDNLKIIVHYDADLYSSTLFALTKIDSLKIPYIAIFDEFWGDEVRALYNYSKSYLPEIEFLHKTIQQNNYPAQIVVKIKPTNN